MARGKKTGGRRQGSRNRRTTERELRSSEAAAAISGALAQLTPEQIAQVLPKDLLLKLMQQYLLAGDLDKAGAVAIQLAPYFHPKLQAVNRTPKEPLSEWTDGELERALTSLRRAAKPKGRPRVH